MEFTIDLKNAIYFITIFGAWLTSYITNKVQTKDNTKKIENLEKENKELKTKCDKMMEEDKAFKAFVTKEFLEAKFEHMEIKFEYLTKQNAEILSLVKEKFIGGK